MDTPHLLWVATKICDLRSTQMKGYRPVLRVWELVHFCQKIHPVVPGGEFSWFCGRSRSFQTFFLLSFLRLQGGPTGSDRYFWWVGTIVYRFPDAPMVGFWMMWVHWPATWRSGQDVGESWWQELASLCILLLKDFEKDSRSRPTCFFRKSWKSGWYAAPKKKKRNWGCGNIFFFQWQHLVLQRTQLGWSPPSRLPVGIGEFAEIPIDHTVTMDGEVLHR